MEKKLKKNLLILIIMNSSLLLFAVLYTLFTELWGSQLLPDRCVSQRIMNFYCPGCGGSRSLAALLHFDVLKSFMIYPPIIISALVILDYDRRLTLTLIRHNTEKTDSFKFYTFILIPISIFLTFLIRNILLLCFKIDTVGDFIP